MNSRIWVLLVVALAAISLAGCEKKESAGEGGAATESSGTVVDDAKNTAADAVDTVKKTAGEAVETAKDAADDAVATAKGLIEKAKQYLADNDLDSIQPILQKLESMKDSLPESLREQIDALAKSVGLAKSVPDGVKIPKGNPFDK